jgi:predicted exporter
VIRYRSLVLGLVVVTPATLASLGTLAVLAIAGTPINLLHMLGLIMVLSIGVDYSIFLMEERQGEHVSGTLLGMAIAGISEILGFGLLAFSSFPALSALGSTATIGVLGCLALSPAVLLVGRPTGLRREIPKVDDPDIGEAGAA